MQMTSKPSEFSEKMKIIEKENNSEYASSKKQFAFGADLLSNTSQLDKIMPSQSSRML